MSVDAHVSSCAGQCFSFTVGDVLFGLGVSVLLGHAKIHDVDDIGRFRVGSPDKEVVGFDVSIDEILLVDSLHS